MTASPEEPALPFPEAQVALLSITRHGIIQAARIAAVLPGAVLHVPEKFLGEADDALARLAPGSHPAQGYAGKTADWLERGFNPGVNPASSAGIKPWPALVAVVSLGALVRMLAPLIGDKSRDPGVVVVDEGGRFAIPVLSGHLGGANALAGRLARRLNLTPVLTTASDSRQTLAVDLLGRELGWTLEADHDALVRAAAAVVNDQPVALVQEAGSRNWWARHANGRSGPLPANLTCFDRLEAVDLGPFAAVLWISRRTLSAVLPPAGVAALMPRLVCYRPPAGDLP